jgi:nucleoside-diphosphate-sugar epimerase
MTKSPPSRVFLAGAAGAIGRRLVPLLLKANFFVVGTTRSEERAEGLRGAGVEPVIVDMFEADAVLRAVVAARPDVVIHQLTDLPRVFDSAVMEAARARNGRLREEATPHLMRAAQAAGAQRAIVQSICFAYAAGPQPFAETDAIDSPSVRAMEASALGTAGVEGVVLRYGRLWGPGTWTEVPKGPAALHVDAAAHAALLAITRGAPGIFNIAEPDGTVSTTKAVRDLGFDPNFRLSP